MRGLLVFGAVATLACAVGEDVDDEGYSGAAGTVAATGGSGGFGGSDVGGSGGGWATGGSGANPGGGQAGAGGAIGGSGGSVGGAGGTGATGGSTATGGSGGTTTGGTGGGSCTSASSCSGATDLGSVSGDSGAGTVQHKASGSKWLKVRVTEDNSSPLGQSLTLQVSLDVPSNADYDLYAYVNTGSDVSPCGSSPTKKSDAGGIGANEQLKLDWGEGTLANGDDDDRTVVIEVRHKAGPCDASAQWQVIGAGNI